MQHILLYIILIVADQLKEMRLQISQLNRKTGLLELKNEDQDKEMQFLKNIIFDCVIIHHHHSTLYDKNLNIYANIIDSSNIHFFAGVVRKRNHSSDLRQTNDLNKIGCTLNGLFLVKDNSTINSKISVIFCDFQAFLEEKRSSLSLSKSSSFIKLDII